MLRGSFCAATAAALGSALPMRRAATGDYRVSGPFVHDNLAIYLVHGTADTGPVPLTLQEALAKGSVRVHETGNVNQLDIENLAGEEVFVQSGDIVKGGQQDRVLMVSLLLPPRSGRVAIASFCVEQGRWSARGKEDVKTFASAASALPSRKAKMAIKAPTPVRRGGRGPARVDRQPPAGGVGERGERAAAAHAQPRRVGRGAAIAQQPAALARERQAQGRAGGLPHGVAGRWARRRTTSSATCSPSTASSTAPRSTRPTPCSAKCGRSS